MSEGFSIHFYSSFLFDDLKTLISNGEAVLSRLDSALDLLQKILSVGVYGLGLYLIFKLLMRGWTKL